MENEITFCGKTDGIAVEQMVRFGQFNMKTKHFHSQYELFYIIEGERVFFFHNRQYLATSGDLILIDTSLIHMTQSLSSKDHGYNRVILYIDYEKMEEYHRKYPELQLIRFFHEHYGVYHLNEEQQSQFLTLYRDLRMALTGKTGPYKTGIDLGIVNWLYKITTQLPAQKMDVAPTADTAKCRTVYAVADYLSANCEENLSLDELAERFYLSKYYLCRIFKEITSYKITEYVNIHRIRKAKHLLEDTDYSISEIARMLGYESITYFEKTFKAYMSVSPLRYRKTRDTGSLLAEEKLGVLNDTVFLKR